MNEILNVNLGGYPFTIDNDAYHHINRYLSAIQRHFADSDGCEEILDDIEARMAELFTEVLNGKAIIGMKELDAVIKVMGRPEDFGAEPYDDDVEEEFSRDKKSFKERYGHIKTGKRFYRDPEEKVIGGVCGGIAAYFGIENPMWIRLLFLGLIFIGGIPIILYPILWAIVPEAKTAGDKLKMRGEPATVSNIARTIEDELNELSDKISEMSKDLGSKKKI
ncbi:MAG: PspC domain-containing protein [Bacteroidota bacterium]